MSKLLVIKPKSEAPSAKKRKIIQEEKNVNSRKKVKKQSPKQFLDASSDKGQECPMCEGTKYKCEICDLQCCSICAQFDPDSEMPDRGHGNVRNHMPGDKRCKK